MSCVPADAWMRPMRLIVTDANIIIDLDAGGLLEAIFQLPGIEFHVPDVLYVEELAARHGRLPGLGLRVTPQPPEAIGDVEALRPRYRRTSANDLFALVLAKRLGCALLSGDRALREAAQQEGVEIRGTLWLIDALLERRLVKVDRVEAAYEAMRLDGSRLPWEEVARQLERWRLG